MRTRTAFPAASEASALCAQQFPARTQPGCAPSSASDMGVFVLFATGGAKLGGDRATRACSTRDRCVCLREYAICARCCGWRGAFSATGRRAQGVMIAACKVPLASIADAFSRCCRKACRAQTHHRRKAAPCRLNITSVAKTCVLCCACFASRAAVYMTLSYACHRFMDNIERRSPAAVKSCACASAAYWAAIKPG